METAKAISNLRFKILDFRLIFRAGVWKPRTSPNTFQGAGDEALQWLREVKEQFGMPVATEVASPEHVEKALKAGIDYLWIGARSSANPLAVQEIANAIDRYAVRPLHCKTQARASVRPAAPVGILIKNPVNADADLWLGNIERLEKTGVPVMAVHRGCNHQPCWEMAHKVRLARPDIPMLLDPSHMSGDASKVPGLMGKIEELGLDGAMVEVHNKPSEALSDAKQQISPDGLTAALKDHYVVGPLPGPTKTGDESPVGLELNWLRAEIDELDERLWSTIAARMDVSKRIGVWKKAHGVAPLQPERYRAISEKLRVKSEELGLRKEFIEQLWNILHEESLRQQ
jgi:chorismate mutase